MSQKLTPIESKLSGLFESFAVVEAGKTSGSRGRKVMESALTLLEMFQFRDAMIDSHRQRRKGGWAFSTKNDGSIVSDCSAESMKAIMLREER